NGRQLEFLAAPARLHHLPRITGRRRGVDDDDAGRALACRLRILVIPAAVVEPRLAGEEIRVVRRAIVHDHQDLPEHVHILEVVPFLLWRDDAVAHEHDLRIVEARRFLLRPRRDHAVVARLHDERGAAAAWANGRRGGGLALDADDVELLIPRAV